MKVVQEDGLDNQWVETAVDFLLADGPFVPVPIRTILLKFGNGELVLVIVLGIRSFLKCRGKGSGGLLDNHLWGMVGEGNGNLVVKELTRDLNGKEDVFNEFGGLLWGGGRF